MDHYSVDGTQKTPTINFDLVKGELDIQGNSIPENSVDFYQPILNIIDEYAVAPKPNTVVNINMRYFNTSSSKRILEIFKKFEVLNKGKSVVSVNWFYEDDDDDMREAAEDYQSVINLPFKLVPIKV